MQRADGLGNRLRDFLLDLVYLLDHSDCPSLNFLQLVLQHFLLLYYLDHDNFLDGFASLFIHRLFYLSNFFDYGCPRFFHLFLVHDNCGDGLLFGSGDGGLRFDQFGFVFNLLIALSYFLENHPLNGLRKGPQNLLLPFLRLHLPSGALPKSVLVGSMDVAVLVAMDLVRYVFDLTATARAQLATGSFRGLGPEGASLVFAAATATSGPAAAFALAFRSLQDPVREDHSDTEDAATRQLERRIAL